MNTEYYAKKFAELVNLEPRLGELEARIKAVKDNGGEYFCANEQWYNHGNTGFKAEMKLLVGWGCPTPELRNDSDYNIAYQHLYNLLPNCRACACPSLPDYLR